MANADLADSPTPGILILFEQINRFPRGSGNEAELRRYLKTWAQNRGYGTRQDPAGNLLIKVPPTAGCERAPIIILQGHLDMVCEKTPDSAHDFLRDPIRHVLEGDWLRADQTSLGADNGIAIALALAVAEAQNITHPPLELLFTVDEENGLTGATNLAPGFLEGRKLINMDSEDEGVFTVGCAGGCKTRLILPLYRTELKEQDPLFQLTVDGARGGHSGVDIIHGRACANRLMGRVLNRLRRSFDLHLLTLEGGSTHNAIARSAQATLSFDAALLTPMRQILNGVEQQLRQEYAAIDPHIVLKLDEVDADTCLRLACDAENTHRLIDLLLALPHGVEALCSETPETVETSCNLATVRSNEHAIDILSSQRSLVPSRLEAMTERVEAIGRLAGLTIQTSDGYPSWQPDWQSELLADCRKIYQQLFNTIPRVQSMHAGLECAVIGAQYDNLEMISIGPTIRNPHSPDEALQISSVGRIWQFLTGLLAFYGAKVGR